MKVKDHFLVGGSFSIQCDTQIRFWKDTWIEDKPLWMEYPSLYNIVRRKDATVAQVLSTVPLNVSFRRDLVGENLVDWHKLVQKVVTVNLNDDKYTFYLGSR
jgi:hypothetical protein